MRNRDRPVRDADRRSRRKRRRPKSRDSDILFPDVGPLIRKDNCIGPSSSNSILPTAAQFTNLSPHQLPSYHKWPLSGSSRTSFLYVHAAEQVVPTQKPLVLIRTTMGASKRYSVDCKTYRNRFTLVSIVAPPSHTFFGQWDKLLHPTIR